VKEKLKLYPALETEMYSYVKMREWEKAEKTEEGPITLRAPVIRASGHYVIKLPESLGEQLHQKKVQLAIATR